MTRQAGSSPAGRDRRPVKRRAAGAEPARAKRLER